MVGLWIAVMAISAMRFGINMMETTDEAGFSAFANAAVFIIAIVGLCKAL